MSNRHRTKDVQWESLFALEDKPAIPLQQRLRLAAVNAILDGRLPPGSSLPSSRELAKALGMSRNTVTSAYMRLIDDGFLEAHPRSGVYVKVHEETGKSRSPGVAIKSSEGYTKVGNRPRGTPFDSSPQPLLNKAPPDWNARLLRSLSDRRTLSKPDQWRKYPYPFIYGTFDPQLFPTEAFRECCVHSLARAHLPQWTPDFELSDVPELIEQIRLRLLPKRGVFALSEEILITVGAQHAYYMLGETLFDSHMRVGLEEPGHPHARNSFASRQPQWVALDVDEQGLVVDRMAPLDYVYVTPSHQSPTTRTLSLERRKQLLALAEQRDFVVIEDDYEAENLYDGEPMPALKSLDKVGRVIYVGSISKSLSPSLRLGYIVAPPALIAELRVLRHAMVRHPSAFLQHAFAHFLSLGHHEPHARRVNQALQSRMHALEVALRQALPDFEFTLPTGGASVWVKAPQWVDTGELARMAREQGVLIEAGEVFFMHPPYPCPYFRLRLSSIPVEQIAPGIQALAKAVHSLANARGVSHLLALPVI